MTICIFSEFKDIFGKVGKGAHKYRLFNTPMVDYGLTLVAAFATTYFTGLPLVLSTIGWYILGIIAHILFGVETPAVKYLGIRC
jgi:hypothetical protein